MNKNCQLFAIGSLLGMGIAKLYWHLSNERKERNKCREELSECKAENMRLRANNMVLSSQTSANADEAFNKWVDDLLDSLEFDSEDEKVQARSELLGETDEFNSSID